MLPTWIIVATGLSLNVIAATTGHFVEAKHMKTLDALTKKQSQNLRTIDLNWQQVQGLENKRDTLLVLVAIPRAMASTTQETFIASLAKQLSLDAQKLWSPNLGALDIGLVEQAINSAQHLSRNHIDDLYIENLQLEEDAANVSLSISRTNNVAFFLQIVGLALMLARDLRIKV